MPRRRGRRTKKSLAANDNGVSIEEKDTQTEKNSEVFQELERQIAAIRAIVGMEVQHLLTGVRLLRSYFNNQLLQVPVKRFFEENLPSVSVVRNGKNGHYELQWKDNDGNLTSEGADGRGIHASLLHHMTMAYPEAVTNIGADNLQSTNPISLDPSDSLNFEMHDVFQTPGANSQRLSIGVTPKTIRLPKHGEMLLSVHGSPLGVYKEDKMEAIRESEED